MSKKEQSHQVYHSEHAAAELVKGLRFIFPQDNVAAEARLLYQQAPITCNVIVAGLPYSGVAVHGTYSGPEVLTFIPGYIHAPQENQSTRVSSGDVGFLRFQGGTHLLPGNKVTSEIAWFYEAGACPSMEDGPIPLNIFARFEGSEWEQFAESCKSIPPGQSKPLKIVAA